MGHEIALIGLNHSTAPIAIRELITFPQNQEGEISRRFLAEGQAAESIVISTCNRSEVLLVADNVSSIIEENIALIGKIHGIPPSSFRDFLYVKTGLEAVHHLFRVSSSLDSMVLGEPQILGQVKEGYRRASLAKCTGPILNRLMHRAFFTAKRVRNETGVGEAAISVAYVAVELARKILGDLRDKSVHLIGAGEMAELAAQHLVGCVEKPLVVLNRTLENACVIAERLNGQADTLTSLDSYLVEADVVITSTGSCTTLITKGQMGNIMKRRRFRPLFIIDIAIPRDVDPEVNELDGVYLYNVDDLQAVADENRTLRKQEAVKAEEIVTEETMKFMEWLSSLALTPTVVAIRNRLEEIRASELAKSNGKLANLTPEQRAAVEHITRSIINKIAHYPVSFLKRAQSKTSQNLYLDIAQRLFQLDCIHQSGKKKDASEERGNNEA